MINVAVLLASCLIINILSDNIRQYPYGLFKTTVMSIYKVTENDFYIIILTESAEYIKLDNLSIIATPNSNEIIDQFAVIYDYNNTDLDNQCISDKNYICSQIWIIMVNDVNCPYSFDGNYGLQWNAQCSNSGNDGDNISCSQYTNQHDDIVTLSADLSFSDNICDPEIWQIRFEGQINYYTDDKFDTIQEEDFEYIIGIDRVYVELVVNIPMNNYSIFQINIYNVWICTSSLDIEVNLNKADIGNTGCFDSRVDGFGPYHIIQNGDQALTANARHESSDQHNIARFSFIVPSSMNNDKIYLQIQAKISLIDANINETTRRILLHSMNTATQIAHFLDDIPVDDQDEIETNTANDSNSTSNFPYGYNLWILVISFVLIILLFCLCIAVFCLMRSNRKYSKVIVKNQDSSGIGIETTGLETEAMAMQHIDQQTAVAKVNDDHVQRNDNRKYWD